MHYNNSLTSGTFILFIFILTLSHARVLQKDVERKPGFVLTSPKYLIAGTKARLSLDLFNLNPDKGCNISVSLSNPHTGDVLSKTIVKRKTGLIELRVPNTPLKHGRLRITGIVDEHPIEAERLIQISSEGPLLIFMQTDKPIYKCGQTVKFRILPVDSQLRLPNNVSGDIWIENPSGLKVEQWLDVSFADGIVQKELLLSSEPQQGKWTIHCSINKENEQKIDFEVIRETALRKFEMTIISPPYILPDDTSLTWNICAKHASGQPVKGKLKLCLTYSGISKWRHIRQFPTLESQPEIHGCHTFVVSADNISLHDKKISYGKSLKLAATVVEDGTGVEEKKISRVRIINEPLKLKFIYARSHTHFKPGIPCSGQLLISYPDGNPASKELVRICVTPRNPNTKFPQSCGRLYSNMNGIVEYTLPPFPSNATFVLVEATAIKHPEVRYSNASIRDIPYIKLYQPRAEMVLTSWYSPSAHYLQIFSLPGRKLQCFEQERVKVLLTSALAGPLDLHFQIVAKGEILVSDKQRVVVNPTTSETLLLNKTFFVENQSNHNIESWRSSVLGEAFITLNTVFKMSPNARLIVYYIRHDGEVVADAQDILVRPCFRNDVQMRFSSSTVIPGTHTSVFIKASPNSLCGIAVTEMTIQRFTQDETRMSKSKVADILKIYDTSRGILYQNDVARNYICKDDVSYSLEEDEVSGLRNFKLSKYVDTTFAFKNSGLVTMSDMTLETRPCSLDPEMEEFLSESEHLFEPPSDSQIPHRKQKDAASEPPVKIPETWLWDILTVDHSGKVEVPYKIPYSNTAWIGSAMCINKQTGFGIYDNAAITTFQPFELSFDVPSSVFRKEKIPIDVTVYGYTSECLPVKISLEKSDYFIIHDGNQAHVCICKGGSEIRRFYIRPFKTGKVNVTVNGHTYHSEGHEVCSQDRKISTIPFRDFATRQLVVEAEGFHIEQTRNYILCPADSKGLVSTEMIPVVFPHNAVEDSGHAHISVTGDLLGPTLQNLDKLIQLPVGCGEQNMILFAPNIFVLNYLKTTGRTEQVHSKALHYMKIGYQRELNYLHEDGSFSAFGKSDEEGGNMWLTAFVAKSFAQARSYIHIDEIQLNRSIEWIFANQMENGCFRFKGRPLHSEMKEELSKGENQTALTAYVIISLLEAGVDPNELKVQLAFNCLTIEKSPSAYSLSLFSYAYALSHSQLARVHLGALRRMAIRDGNMMYWEMGKKSVNIEVASYAVLALLEDEGIANLAKTAPIIRWIIQQRNSNGGFISTQDTVIALQALSKYATFISKSKQDLSISLKGDGINYQLKINSDNRILMQTIPLSQVPSIVEVAVHGEGCALMQSSVQYNVRRHVSRYDAFNLKVTSKRRSIVDCKVHEITTCISYKYVGKTSNMVIVEVRLVSGFSPENSSLIKMQESSDLQLKKYEVIGNYVYFYFYELENKLRCFNFNVKRVVNVQDTLPAIASLYDYYNPDQRTSVNYTLDLSCEEKRDQEEVKVTGMFPVQHQQ